MSDLVERLREYGANPGIPPEGAYELALKAADEIERLRAALEQIKYECAKCKYIAREALRDEEE